MKTTSFAIPAVMDAPGAVILTSSKRDIVDATRGACDHPDDSGAEGQGPDGLEPGCDVLAGLLLAASAGGAQTSSSAPESHESTAGATCGIQRA